MNNPSHTLARPPAARGRTPLMPTVFSAAQLAASATAGDPRTQDSFATTAEWHAYQAEWFKTVTMGEDLPPVGDPNRAKRWKSTRQQRGKIELQRERQQQPRAPWQRPARNDRQKADDNEYHKERRQREAQLRGEEDDALEFLEQIHDASGAMMNANARRLATLAPDAASNERVRRIEEQEKVYAELLVQGGLATSELEAREKFFAAAHFHGIITAVHETPRQLVKELAYMSQDYMDFVLRVGHDGDKAVRLPRFIKPSEDEPQVPPQGQEDVDRVEEDLVAGFARLTWSDEEVKKSHTHRRMLPRDDNWAWAPRGWDPCPGEPRPMWTAWIPDGCGGQRALRATYDVFEGEGPGGDGLWETRRFTMPYPPVIDFPGITLTQVRGIQLACAVWFNQNGWADFEFGREAGDWIVAWLTSSLEEQQEEGVLV